MINKINLKKDSFTEDEVEYVQFIMAKIFKSINPQPEKVAQTIITIGNSQSGISTLINFLIGTPMKGKQVTTSKAI